jgi:hypothetical protein
LPLFVPVLIFGAGAAEAQAAGLSPAPHLSLLARSSSSPSWPCPSRSAPRCASRSTDDEPLLLLLAPDLLPPRRLLAPWFFAAALLAPPGLYIGFVVAPTDAQQGEVYRVIFIHVPAAWMSMFLYFVMACYGASSLTFNTRSRR